MPHKLIADGLKLPAVLERIGFKSQELGNKVLVKARRQNVLTLIEKLVASSSPYAIFRGKQHGDIFHVVEYNLHLAIECYRFFSSEVLGDMSPLLQYREPLAMLALIHDRSEEEARRLIMSASMPPKLVQTVQELHTKFCEVERILMPVLAQKKLEPGDKALFVLNVMRQHKAFPLLYFILLNRVLAINTLHPDELLRVAYQFMPFKFVSLMLMRLDEDHAKRLPDQDLHKIETDTLRRIEKGWVKLFTETHDRLNASPRERAFVEQLKRDTCLGRVVVRSGEYEICRVKKGRGQGVFSIMKLDPLGQDFMELTLSTAPGVLESQLALDGFSEEEIHGVVRSLRGIDYYALTELLIRFVNDTLIPDLDRALAHEGLSVSECIEEIEGRRKDLPKVVKNIQTKDIFDLVGIRLICRPVVPENGGPASLHERKRYVDALLRALDSVLDDNGNKKYVSKKEPKDFFLNPKNNGYADVVLMTYDGLIEGRLPLEIQFVKDKETNIRNNYSERSDHLVYSMYKGFGLDMGLIYVKTTASAEVPLAPQGVFLPMFTGRPMSVYDVVYLLLRFSPRRIYLGRLGLKVNGVELKEKNGEFHYNVRPGDVIEVNGDKVISARSHENIDHAEHRYHMDHIVNRSHQVTELGHEHKKLLTLSVPYLQGQAVGQDMYRKFNNARIEMANAMTYTDMLIMMRIGSFVLPEEFILQCRSSLSGTVRHVGAGELGHVIEDGVVLSIDPRPKDKQCSVVPISSQMFDRIEEQRYKEVIADKAIVYYFNIVGYVSVPAPHKK